ncbi:MAG: flavin reductase family protein [Solobacterium sp.]|nr:flavin reductase family protein [Solobacterium sp.]
MKRTEIRFSDYAGKIIEALRSGILLTTKADGKVNTMVIGWGTLGINWSRPVMTVFVRDSRYTKQLLDQNGEFTVNVPMEKLSPQVMQTAGSLSGRDIDKIAALGLTLIEPAEISVPAIAEYPLTLECKVLYSQRQHEEQLPDQIRNRLYPADENGTMDAHTSYYAQIVAAYILEEE